MDFLHGRPTQDDDTLFGFAAYSEREHDGQGLHDQIARLVLMVVSPSLVERLADPEYIKCLDVAHSGYRPRCERLHDFASEWQRLQTLPDARAQLRHRQDLAGHSADFASLRPTPNPCT